MSETSLGQFTLMGSLRQWHLLIGRHRIIWLIIIRPQQLNSLVFTDKGHIIFKGLHPSDCSVPCSRLAGSLKALPDGRPSLRELCQVFFLVLLCDGWRVLPADFQVYPPIWRAGGRLANTLVLHWSMSCYMWLVVLFCLSLRPDDSYMSFWVWNQHCVDSCFCQEYFITCCIVSVCVKMEALWIDFQLIKSYTNVCIHAYLYTILRSGGWIWKQDFGVIFCGWPPEKNSN